MNKLYCNMAATTMHESLSGIHLISMVEVKY